MGTPEGCESSSLGVSVELGVHVCPENVRPLPTVGRSSTLSDAGDDPVVDIMPLPISDQGFLDGLLLGDGRQHLEALTHAWNPDLPVEIGVAAPDHVQERVYQVPPR